MAMQSQSNRLGSRGGNRARSAGLGKAPKIGLLVLGLAAAAYFFWSPGDDSETGETAAQDNPAGVAGDNSAAPADPGQRVDRITARDAAPPASSATVPASPAPPAPPAPPADLAELAGLSAPGRRPAGSSVNASPPPRADAVPASGDPAPATLPTPPTPPSSAASTAAATTPDPQVREAARSAVASLPRPKPFDSGADAATLYNRGDQLLASGDLLGGRRLLSRMLFSPDLRLSARDADAVRQRLDDVNNRLLWTPDFVENDPITQAYQNDGSYLSSIGVKFRVPYQLLEIINGIRAQQLRADHVLKVVQGPIHARVTKHSFKMDLYANDPEGQPIYLCSFPVGLGKDDKTPPGNWQVVAGSKVVNPDWRDDLNGEYFTSDNPDNPIGEYWIKIRGLDASNRGKQGFGIHGTIEPDSIGTEASRGCIRLADDDIKMVFYMLTDHSDGSTVQIVP